MTGIELDALKQLHNGTTIYRSAHGYAVHHPVLGYMGTFTGLEAATEYAFALVVRS